MISTFHGLETSRRALTASQAALHTTGHNIANANTPGYSRQRVNLVQGEPFPNPGMNRPAIPGQLGTGVKVDSIQRYREHFLDSQYRGENSKQGYWDARFVSLQKMEDIMNEPSEDGIATAMDRFWNSLQDLSVHPEDSGARSVVRQRGYALAETFNYVSDSLTTIQKDLKKEIQQTERDVNTILRQINSINFEISKIEPHGYVTNDLYDRRDLLVDQLSEYMNIKVDSVPSKGMPSPVAEGLYTINLVDKDGNDLGVKLIDGENPISGDHADVVQAKVRFDGAGENALVNTIVFGTMNATGTDIATELRDFSVEELNTNGKLKAQIGAYGYNHLDNAGTPILDADGNPIVKGLYPEMVEQLDIMVATFVEEFNAIHASGWSITDINAGTKQPPINFFEFSTAGIDKDNPKGAASALKLHDNIRNNLDNIAASAAADWVDTPAPGHYAPKTEAFSGDGSNAQALANVKDKLLNYGGSTTNVHSFYQGVIGDMAVNTNEADRMKRNSETLRASVDERRASVSSVSLDEEFTNMIKFQHAYNAAARNITNVDDMLDRIINRMGRAGL